ncbi:MAG: hypothetical protein CMP58_01660 [Flavobacteriales bacterium]|nr:hypothetical protein [Flavobacteriales bacterium]
MKSLILFVLFFNSIILFSQNKINEANSFFYKKEYSKAVEIYKEIEKENLTIIYNNYLKSLFKLNDHTTANKIINKQIIKFPENPIYKIDKGYFFIVKNKKEKAYNIFNKILQNTDNYKKNILTNTANKFLEIKEYDFAIKTLQKGIRKYPNVSMELNIANIHRQKGETEEMTKKYIEIVKKYPEKKQRVLNIFQNIFGRDGSQQNEKYSTLQENLIKELQISNNKDILDMIIWTYMQQYEFDKALKYSKIADKKYTQYGNKIFEIGLIVKENKEYETATKCFEYLSKNYKEYKLLSELEIIKIKREKCKKSICGKEELKKIDLQYQNFIQEYGANQKTYYLLKDYANFLAFNYNNPDTAVFILNELKKVTLDNIFKSECNLSLAEILLKTNKPWDAIKIYSELERDFKNEKIGHLAKFNKAKIYFYTGNIDWAKAHLDILKLATSKLIANDAMKMSLLITDNSNLDTSYDVIIMYAKAEYYFVKKEYEKSIYTLDSIIKGFPSHSIKDEIYLLKSNIYIEQGLYDSALQELDKIIKNHYYDIICDEALFKYAEIIEKKHNEEEQAMEIYNKIITDFPNSIYAQKARKKYRKLRGDKDL